MTVSLEDKRRDNRRNEPTVDLVKFEGLNNKISPYTLGATWFKELLNADVVDSQGIQLRPGYVKQFPLSDVYSTRDYDYCFGIDTDQNLVELGLDLNTNLPFIKSVLASNVGPPDEEGLYHWCDAGHFTFLMTKTTTLSINTRAEDNKVTPWGAPVPEVYTARVISGNLPPGQYVYTLTYQNLITGLESGALTYQTITLPSTGGIQFELPQISGYAVNLYVSHGPLPLRLTTTQNPTVNYTDTLYLGEPIRTLGITGPPLGTAIGYWRSSIYVGVHNQQQGFSRVYRSQPSRFHHFVRGEDSPDIIDLPGEIRLLADSPVGLVLGTDKEIWLRNLDNETVPLRNYGVIYGRCDWDTRGRVYFVTPRGVCSVGAGDTYFIEHTRPRLSADWGTLGIVNILETGGVDRVVTTVIPSGIIYNKPNIFDTIVTEYNLTGDP